MKICSIVAKSGDGSSDGAFLDRLKSGLIIHALRAARQRRALGVECKKLKRHSAPIFPVLIRA
jgi:hypothetical protein